VTINGRGFEANIDVDLESYAMKVWVGLAI
jgi:hypothetical protein